MRRVCTPMCKEGKATDVRQLHNSTWGIFCPSETPEGASCGLIKNLANKYNLRIANGYGPIKEKTFRIAHMGDTQLDEIEGLLKAIETVVEL